MFALCKQSLGKIMKRRRIAEWQKPYCSETKCNCAVCLIARYLDDKGPRGAAEAWLNDGYILEGVTRTESIHSELLENAKAAYKRHFTKRYIDKTYVETEDYICS